VGTWELRAQGRGRSKAMTNKSGSVLGEDGRDQKLHRPTFESVAEALPFLVDIVVPCIGLGFSIGS
jgi:hypothetical protein